MTRLLRRLIPPIAIELLGRWRGTATRFTGPLASWDAARQRSAGYGAASILEQVARATEKVTSGEAASERDGVLLDRIEYSFPLLATLLRAALENRRGLHVIDFGGALGGSYRECRPFLDAVQPLSWSVVEQEAYVAYGQRRVQNEELRFFRTLPEAIERAQPDVILLSSVLQYLEDPLALLAGVVSLRAPYLVIDRTIVNTSTANRIYVQHVPAHIYSASYPVWSLSESSLTSVCSGGGYALVSEHASLDFDALAGIASRFKGYIFRMSCI